MRHHHRHSSTGFSLIEVLVGLIILSIGLLALGSLQASLMRSSADAKARSGAMALAEDKLEQIRQFADRTTTVACPAATAANWPGQYRCITDLAQGSAETFNDTNGDRGGINYTRWWQVQRYVYDSDPDNNAATRDGAFVAVAGDSTTDTQVLTADASLRPGNEFKQVTLNVGWTDPASNTPRRITLVDNVSAVAPRDSARVRRQARDNNSRPAVLYRDPGDEIGVIPIATGSGSETAATNPRPEVVGQGNQSIIVETRFDVLTYAALANSNLVEAQSRVETAVVGCRCQTSNAAGTSFRPTYWNGKKYVAPEAGPAGLGVPTNATQSTLCTACCRDHQDPVGVTGAKYDNFRNSHDHYATASGSPVTSGQYSEACRVIRVDGFQRVAADVNAEHLGLVATENSARSPVPAATQAYEDFVLDYLDDRFVSGTAYNTIPGTAATVAATNGLDLPAEVSITKPATGTDERWLHARGLYVDFLEPEAVAYVNEQKSECTESPADAGCVLPFVPFTTINVTELARWMSQNTGVVNVTNNTGVLFGDPTSPVRGKVQAAPAATANATANIVPNMTKSNSGLALAAPIDPNDAADNTDSQAFRIDTAAAEVNDTFQVFIGNMSFTPGNFPVVGYRVGGIRSDCTAAATPTTPNPYTCATTTTNDNKGVVVNNFNQQGSTLGDNPCTSNRTETDFPVPFCITRTVSSVFSADGEVASMSYSAPGKLSEVATASFTGLGDGETVAFVFNNPVTSPATSYVCGGPGNKTPAYTLPCQ